MELLKAVSASVAKRHRGAKLLVGNVSLRRGGRSPWHRSHQSGRDIDLCFYVRDTRGRPAVMDNFTRFRASGWSRDRKWKFDDQRNLSLALALAQSETPAVQWVFIARWLKRRIMAAAQTRGLTDEQINRLDTLLLQPSDSACHDDHFHVRVFCSLQDRKYGCINTGPPREWVDDHQAEFSEHINAISALMQRPEVSIRRRAIGLLLRIEAKEASAVVIKAIDDNDPTVRSLAVKMIHKLALSEAAPALLARLKMTRVLNEARKLWAAWLALKTPDQLQLAIRLLTSMKGHMSSLVAKKMGLEIRMQSIELLTQRRHLPAVPALISTTLHKNKKLRLRAHAGLLALTNQFVRDRYLKRRGSRHWKKTHRAWLSVWKRVKTQNWLTSFKRGFKDHGVRLTRSKRFTKRDVPKLIRALTTKRVYLANNAERVLVRITGHRVWRKGRSSKRLRRTWARWWKRRGRKKPLRS